jgi:hypothetical protein
MVESDFEIGAKELMWTCAALAVAASSRKTF